MCLKGFLTLRESFLKMMIRFNKITSLIDTGISTSTVITGGIFIVKFANDFGLSHGITLNGTSLVLTAITQKSFKIFIIKLEKHDSIKIISQSKLDSIANISSQTVQDENI